MSEIGHPGRYVNIFRTLGCVSPRATLLTCRRLLRSSVIGWIIHFRNACARACQSSLNGERSAFKREVTRFSGVGGLRKQSGAEWLRWSTFPKKRDAPVSEVVRSSSIHLAGGTTTNKRSRLSEKTPVPVYSFGVLVSAKTPRNPKSRSLKCA
jgi:hypothetical protein